MNYETLKLDIQNKIAHVSFNRPRQSNALNEQGWDEVKHVFEACSENPEVRVVVLSGEGRNFCAGMDLSVFANFQKMWQGDCEGRMREQFRKTVFRFQAPINAIDHCSKPVLAAIHGACVGGGVDLVTACDMRYATDDAFFSIAEIDIGMVADIGTLQRLPKLIGDGMVREMAYTGRRVFGPEAEKIGLTNRTFADKESMLAEVMNIAATIASKSPLSVRGTKEIVRYARDHSVADGLNYVATWNAAMFYSDDLRKAIQAKMMKQQVEFMD